MRQNKTLEQQLRAQFFRGNRAMFALAAFAALTLAPGAQDKLPPGMANSDAARLVQLLQEFGGSAPERTLRQQFSSPQVFDTAFDGKSRDFTKTGMPSFDQSIVGRIFIVCRAGARIRGTRNGEVVSLCSKNDRQFN